MRLVTFEAPGGASRPGLVLGEPGAERVCDLARALDAPAARCLGTLLEAIPLDDLRPRLAALANGDADGPRLSEVRLLAPVPRPPKVTAVGLNYRDHALEQKAAIPERPMLFSKARTSVSGPLDPIRILPEQTKVDYECELCLVVGRPGFRVPRERACDWLLGYTVAVDVSDRAAQQADKQFYRAKSFPTFCPIGPEVMTEDSSITGDSPGPGDLRLTTRLDGRLLQDGNTSQMIFDIPTIVAYVSAVAPLEPGDLILTGTPAGVGVARDPQVFLRPGGRLLCGIEGIGALYLGIEEARG